MAKPYMVLFQTTNLHVFSLKTGYFADNMLCLDENIIKNEKKHKHLKINM